MHYNNVSTQRLFARIRVRASDKCTNRRPQMHERAFEANGYGRPTDSKTAFKQASDRMSTERATTIGSCRKCWHIPANDTYVIPANDTCEWRAFKSNELERCTIAYFDKRFRQRELRWASIWHWELPKKKQVGSPYKRIVYSVGTILTYQCHWSFFVPQKTMLWCIGQKRTALLSSTSAARWIRLLR